MKMHKVEPHSMREEMGSMKDKHFPSFSIDIKNLPEVKDWKNGQFYEVKMTVKQMSSSMNHASFDIHEIGGEATTYKENSKGKAKTSQERYSRSQPSPDMG